MPTTKFGTRIASESSTYSCSCNHAIPAAAIAQQNNKRRHAAATARGFRHRSRPTDRPTDRPTSGRRNDVKLIETIAPDIRSSYLRERGTRQNPPVGRSTNAATAEASRPIVAQRFVCLRRSIRSAEAQATCTGLRLGWAGLGWAGLGWASRFAGDSVQRCYHASDRNLKSKKRTKPSSPPATHNARLGGNPTLPFVNDE